MQSVYAFVQSGKDNVVTEQKNMLRSIDNIFDLYILLLDMVVEVVEWDKTMIDKKKNRLSNRGKTPPLDETFVENKFVAKLADNTVLRHQLEDRKIRWKNNDM